jgi:hypothetical protein
VSPRQLLRSRGRAAAWRGRGGGRARSSSLRLLRPPPRGGVTAASARRRARQRLGARRARPPPSGGASEDGHALVDAVGAAEVVGLLELDVEDGGGPSWAAAAAAAGAATNSASAATLSERRDARRREADTWRSSGGAVGQRRSAPAPRTRAWTRRAASPARPASAPPSASISSFPGDRDQRRRRALLFELPGELLVQRRRRAEDRPCTSDWRTRSCARSASRSGLLHQRAAAAC